MEQYLSSQNFQMQDRLEEERLTSELAQILETDGKDGILGMLAGYRTILANNARKDDWETVNARLLTLFKCGAGVPLDGPMIGVSLSIRDSDYFRKTARLFGNKRSVLANIEWMASLWNATFGNSGIWMGKTFEPVDKQTAGEICAHNPSAMENFRKEHTRIGRNFFRQPPDPTLLQLAGLPVLTSLWGLQDRPLSPEADGFRGVLLDENLQAERFIPYSKTGGLFLANPGDSVIPEMNRKPVYQLNYRWPNLGPIYPMTRLVDELVQIDDGIFLGQLVMATRNYSLGKLKLAFISGDSEIELGEKYDPSRPTEIYGYQNNGFFLMIDPRLADKAYADDAFPQLRPQAHESGYAELGYGDRKPSASGATTGTTEWLAAQRSGISDWYSGWLQDTALKEKFTTFCLEASPKEGDSDVRELLRNDESILQMLQRIQTEISAQTRYDDHLAHFEKLNRLFRSGVAPTVKDGVFHRRGGEFNVRYDGLADRTWYGAKEPLTGFDYYHGATLNLHWGFADTFRPQMDQGAWASTIFPTSIAAMFQDEHSHPNLLNMVWASIARFIFPWAGKSFETISGRKLSMLLDESDDLQERYAERVGELKKCIASQPHYELIKKNAAHFWDSPGIYAAYLQNGAWDQGMPDEDRAFWNDLAAHKWVFGNNLMDRRIEAVDSMMRILDINYRVPEPPLMELASSGPSPFVRMGYCFIGLADATSILPMNNGSRQKKSVFQFHYRYPMIGGPVPIGACLDEIVEIARGLFLGQLIYSTKPLTPFHSSVDPAAYAYQLFGYFLLLDNDWECHRQAIGLDVWR
jgi:hypothetical protein